LTRVIIRNSVFGQKPTLELTFTAIDNLAYVQIDSIKVMNRTQGFDTVLYWPDTVLALEYQLGVPELNPKKERLQVFQNYPNPVVDQTTISLYVPKKDEVGIIITDILGREILKTDWVLEKGIHYFRFAPGSGNLFIFTAQWRGNSSNVKILQAASTTYTVSSLEYIGSESSSTQLKTTEDIQSFLFNLGDELLYIGYANELQSGILDTPSANETLTFQFATNIPCLGTPTVTYKGQVYNTIQIFSQCWMKENLNVGNMINGEDNMEDNGTIEKYCAYNDPAQCDTYGGLYQWNEMMQYNTQQGTQGICPTDWHLPTDEEWKVLEGAVDSQYGIGDYTWENVMWRGFDAGTNLKTTSGWYEGGNGTDLFGYSGIGGGYCNPTTGEFEYLTGAGFWWLSTEGNDNEARVRNISWEFPEVGRGDLSVELGFSVRCLRDY